MEDHAFDQMLERLMKVDFAAGTEAFRDSLLARCLTELNGSGEGESINDADLELLAAAGTMPVSDPSELEPRDAIGHNGGEDLLA